MANDGGISASTLWSCQPDYLESLCSVTFFIIDKCATLTRMFLGAPAYREGVGVRAVQNDTWEIVVHTDGRFSYAENKRGTANVGLQLLFVHLEASAPA